MLAGFVFLLSSHVVTDASASILPPLCSAFEIQGTIYPMAAEKVAPFKVLLNGGEQLTYARADGSFVFRNVAPGRYVVDIPSELFLFSQVCPRERVDERSRGWMLTDAVDCPMNLCATPTLTNAQYKLDVAPDGVIRALEYKYPGAGKQRAEYPLVAEAVTELNYFEQREKFNLFGLIMSPSFLTIVVPIGLLYVLPKLSEGMMGAFLRALRVHLCGCVCRCGSIRVGRPYAHVLIYVNPPDPEEFKKAQEEIGTQDPASLISGMFGGAPARSNDDSDDD